ncbi:MAG: choice-of-anchor J domain-containing protein [Muribaculaceae bacterium]|nr:choice-of-anchor J domain-containing protein [Muribaculaceae bacterium]
MKKFLFITLALVLAATGAWAIKAKIDTTTKAKMQVTAVDKASDTTTPIMALRAMGAKDPEGAVTVPYFNTFDTEEEQGQLSVYDANQDQTTWGLAAVSGGGYEAVYSYSSANAADDYLLLPPMQLEAGMSYKFAIDARSRSTSYVERFEVVLLDEAGENVVQTVIASTDVTSAIYSTFSNDNLTVAETGFYTFAIHAISDADMWALYVDNVAVTANIDNDLGITLSAPATVKAGQTVTATATVTNGGANAAQNFTVNITQGNEALLNQTVAEELAAGATKSFTVEVPTTVFDAEKVFNFAAQVIYETDENAGNNSAEATTTVVASDVNPVENLTAEGAEGGTIELNWEAVEAPEVYTEDFENTDIFPEWNLGGITTSVHNGAIGDWTLYDANGTATYGYNGVTVPNLGSAMAWVVFAPNSPNISANLMDSQAPHSGFQAMASYCVTSGATDHWMISPELTGEAQTISFWARELTDQYGTETFEVLASSTDNASTSFTLVQSLSSSVTDWAEYTAALPEGTKYFAIRHTSNDIFALFIDDITYKPAAPPTGTVPTAFNIYLDGVLVGTVNGDVTTYTIEGVEPGDYVCSVTAVYGDIESAPISANATVPEVIPVPDPVITVDVAFGTYTEAQTVHVTVENMPEGGAIKYQLVPSSSKEEWSDYDNATGIAVNESAALTVAVFDANGEELARLEGEYVIDTQTGIATIGVDGYDNNAWYNLNGQKLNGKPVVPGIYINGGKKVVVK